MILSILFCSVQDVLIQDVWSYLVHVHKVLLSPKTHLTPDWVHSKLHISSLFNAAEYMYERQVNEKIAATLQS